MKEVCIKNLCISNCFRSNLLLLFFFSGTQLAVLECVVCRKKKTVKLFSGYEKLQKVVTFDGAYRLKETVVKRNDDEWTVVWKFC